MKGGAFRVKPPPGLWSGDGVADNIRERLPAVVGAAAHQVCAEIFL